MTDTQKVVHLTEDEFIDRFQPESYPDGSVYVQRDWTDPKDLLVLREVEGNRIWTALDNDGEFTIGQGRHVVNRLFYIITAVPYDDTLEYVIDCS